MNSLKALDSLWGAIIYDLEINLLLQSAKFSIKVHTGDVLNFYELKFKEIVTLNVINKKTDPWNYAELTEIYFSKEDYYKFTMLLWSEDHTIDIVCKNWELVLVEKSEGFLNVVIAV